MRRAVESAGERAVLIAGPAGSGKTTLLLGLAAELAPPRRAVYLAQPRLPLGGFWMRLAGELDLEPGYDAKRRVLRRAAELAREGGALVLMVDDAHELPAETLYALLATARSEPGLQLLLARSDDASLAGPLPDDVPVVRTGGMGPVPSEALPMPETITLPALTARRRRRERRARVAFAAAGLAAGLAIGTLLSAPAWRAIQRAQAPPATPDLAAPGAPLGDDAATRLPAAAPPRATPPVADRAPALPAQPAPAPATPQDSAPDLAARAVERAVALPVGERDAMAEAPPESGGGDVPPLGARPPQAGIEAPAAAPPIAAPAPAPVPAPAPAAPAPGALAERVPPPAARPSEPAPQPASPLAPGSAPAATPPDVAAPAPVWRPRPGPPAGGRLAVNSDSDVRIEIDGRLYGAAPLVGIQLSRGEHRVMAHYPDGAVALKTIYLDADDVSVFFR